MNNKNLLEKFTKECVQIVQALKNKNKKKKQKKKKILMEVSQFPWNGRRGHRQQNKSKTRNEWIGCCYQWPSHTHCREKACAHTSHTNTRQRWMKRRTMWNGFSSLSFSQTKKSLLRLHFKFDVAFCCSFFLSFSSFSCSFRSLSRLTLCIMYCYERSIIINFNQIQFFLIKTLNL